MFKGKTAIVLTLATLAALVVLGGTLEKGQAAGRSIEPVPVPTVESGADKKGFSGYRGVTIGLQAADVRLKLGSPKDKGDDQDLYMFSDYETAQFFYDASHAVSAIMITYSGSVKEALRPVDLFGEDAPAKPDGGIFKMERYPKAGYWISYNRTPGNDATVSIAVQKIPR